MFTGLIEELGTVTAIEPGDDGVRLRVQASFAGEVGDGDSVAVNGVCLTALDLGANFLQTARDGLAILRG